MSETDLNEILRGLNKFNTSGIDRIIEENKKGDGDLRQFIFISRDFAESAIYFIRRELKIKDNIKEINIYNPCLREYIPRIYNKGEMTISITDQECRDLLHSWYFLSKYLKGKDISISDLYGTKFKPPLHSEIVNRFLQIALPRHYKATGSNITLLDDIVSGMPLFSMVFWSEFFPHLYFYMDIVGHYGWNYITNLKEGFKKGDFKRLRDEFEITNRFENDYNILSAAYYVDSQLKIYSYIKELNELNKELKGDDYKKSPLYNLIRADVTKIIASISAEYFVLSDYRYNLELLSKRLLANENKSEIKLSELIELEILKKIKEDFYVQLMKQYLPK
ncbi:transcriptional regulator protein [Nanobdella aerobiophila]|uniref:Transcriptional regulator protein n=1 Tax=Nanobdella aerobiophila TaxID=2586965 RepID=A0A915WRF4_9ARCH|nr:hypothetical protein [Nanobdella aerobiophila]BBL45543.1 transcriptional regulator protein [Nanobdella aerobiophila]